MSSSLREHLGETAVYRLYDKTDRLLYVGIGSVPESRWRDHAAVKDWWPDVARKTVEWHPTAAAATAAETVAIDTENPLRVLLDDLGQRYAPARDLHPASDDCAADMLRDLVAEHVGA